MRQLHSAGGQYGDHARSDTTDAIAARYGVEESPSTGRRTLVPLDNFGAVSFTGATAIQDGQQHTIAQAGGKSITMIDATGQPVAQPAALGADGASFTVTRTPAPAPRIVPGGQQPTSPPTTFAVARHRNRKTFAVAIVTGASGRSADKRLAVDKQVRMCECMISHGTRRSIANRAASPHRIVLGQISPQRIHW